MSLKTNYFILGNQVARNCQIKMYAKLLIEQKTTHFAMHCCY